MRTIKLSIAYDGTEFAGWQKQPGKRTIEGLLEPSLEKILREKVELAVAGRTDAGVHALGQVASFYTHSRLPPETLRRALNANLPPEIRVWDVAEVASAFHATRSAIKKCYQYLIFDGPLGDPFSWRYTWHYRWGRLDAESMQEAAHWLVGTHDFASFQSAGSPRTDTVRTIFQAWVRRIAANRFSGMGPIVASIVWQSFSQPPPRQDETGYGSESPLSRADPLQGEASASNHSLVVVEVEGNGFLYNMVRIIVGSLVEVGRQARSPDWLKQVLEGRDRRLAGPTAPPHGLFLTRVDYPAELLKPPVGSHQAADEPSGRPAGSCVR